MIRWVAITGVIGALLSGLALWSAYRLARRQLSESRCDGHERFVQSEWLDTTKSFGRLAIRGCMIDDLLRRHELRGMTRAQVVTLLGEPPVTEEVEGYDLVYWLGPERGLIGTDSEWLVLRLDKHQKVTDAQLIVE